MHRAPSAEKGGKAQEFPIRRDGFPSKDRDPFPGKNRDTPDKIIFFSCES
jgi:hypothetical protein